MPRRVGVGCLLVLLLTACGPVPGGRLAGVVETPPEDWSGLGGFCDVESRPQDPHSIQLECFEDGGSLYAQSHRWALVPWYPFESWAAIWLEHPEVRVRFGDTIYELSAQRVPDSPLRTRILARRGYEPVPDGIVLFSFAR